MQGLFQEFKNIVKTISLYTISIPSVRFLFIAALLLVGATSVSAQSGVTYNYVEQPNATGQQTFNYDTQMFGLVEAGCNTAGFPNSDLVANFVEFKLDASDFTSGAFRAGFTRCDGLATGTMDVTNPFFLSDPVNISEIDSATGTKFYFDDVVLEDLTAPFAPNEGWAFYLEGENLVGSDLIVTRSNVNAGSWRVGVEPNGEFATGFFQYTPFWAVGYDSNASSTGTSSDVLGAGSVDRPKGVADEDLFTFEVVYTDASNAAPDSINVLVGTSSFAMLETATSTSVLDDDDYTNGELFSTVSTFPQGAYTFSFEATTGGNTETLADPGFTFTTGYSSVAFIPGSPGSRLFRGAEKVWVSETNAEAQELAFNASGQSINTDVTVGDVIDESFGLNIYKSFIVYLNSQEAQGIFERWEPLPYDWRYDLEEVVNNPLLSTSSDNMLDIIADLAANSNSGKVTIIGHSNGGLIGKQIITELASSSQADIIDQFIMVATPQLGTPKGIAGMLHGTGQRIGGGILLSKLTARDLAQYFPGAYNLLPSAEYISRVADPVASFEPGVLTDQFITAYGSDISDGTELRDFLLGTEGRSAPPAGSIFEASHPIQLGQTLLDDAIANQAQLATWTAPSNVAVTQIAGWGLDTAKTLKYRSSKDFNDNDIIRIEVDHTADGDETVVFASAASLAGAETYFFNLDKHNTDLGSITGANAQHADILELNELHDLLTQKITSSADPLPNFITPFKPDKNVASDRLRLRILSPVAITITDSVGSTTGKTLNPDPASDLQLVKEEIPNSYYEEFGEGKYLGIPTDDTFQIDLEGTGTGTFTYEIDYVVADEVETTYAFEDVPVTPSLKATMTLDESASTTAPVLNLDNDGDGTVDQVLTPSTNGVAPDEYHYLEAESYDSITAPMTTGTDTNTSNGSFVYVPQGGGNNVGDATYTVTLDGGDYKIWGRTKATNGGDDSFFVTVDGQQYLWDVQRGNTWRWGHVRDRGGANPVIVNLAPGTYTITFGGREDNTKLDRILITSNLDFIPSGFGEIPPPPTPPNAIEEHWLETENPDTITAPMTVQTDSQASNGEYIEVPDGNGLNTGAASYDITITEPGEYTIWGRTIATNGGNNSFYIQVDNEPQVNWTVFQTNDWEWDRVNSSGQSEPFTFNLTAGTHTIYVKGREDETKIDKLFITNDIDVIPTGLGDPAENL